MTYEPKKIYEIHEADEPLFGRLSALFCALGFLVLVFGGMLLMGLAFEDNTHPALIVAGGFYGGMAALALFFIVICIVGVLLGVSGLLPEGDGSEAFLWPLLIPAFIIIFLWRLWRPRQS